MIEAIRDEELLDNNIQFDWLLPRFIARMREHGKEVGEQQLAEGFGRLASDLFWMPGSSRRDCPAGCICADSRKDQRAGFMHDCKKRIGKCYRIQNASCAF